MSVRLFSAARSSASFRVRIALGIKGIAYDYEAVDLVGGEQLGDAYTAINPSALVPVLEIDGLRLSQSLAIIEYLEETRPHLPSLLPASSDLRAIARAAAQAIACDIHPVNNLRVLKYLTEKAGASTEVRDRWYRHWVEQGLEQLETQVARANCAGQFLVRDAPSVADICLVPQIFNARRLHARLDRVPTLMRAFEACMALPAFANAQWDRQPDFKP